MVGALFHVSTLLDFNSVQMFLQFIYPNKVMFFCFQIKTRVDNEKFLRDHPEVECLLAGFLG